MSEKSKAGDSKNIYTKNFEPGEVCFAKEGRKNTEDVPSLNLFGEESGKTESELEWGEADKGR